MHKKYICCVHDKKSDIFNGFMLFENMTQALRSFQMACEQDQSFQKWPEDFQFVLVGTIEYEDGTIDENNEIVKEANFKEIKQKVTVLAEAKDFVAIKNAKATK